MLSKRIQNRVFWVGAQNPDLRTFDVVMHTDAGTSYNSYLIMGSEKTAVVDGVREAYATEHIAKISEHCDPAKLDYIVCNHTEPDHSGSLVHLLEMAPHATVLCTKAGSLFLKKLVPRDFKCRVVEDGERVSLGDVTLRFVQAPFLHWPDSLFTFAEEEGILFSGDVFSFHMAGEGLFDDEIAWTGEMEAAQRYYFDTLLAPFRSYVLDALEKIRGLSIRMIAPAHGPLRRANPQALLEVYRYPTRPRGMSPMSPAMAIPGSWRRRYTGRASGTGWRWRWTILSKWGRNRLRKKSAAWMRWPSALPR